VSVRRGCLSCAGGPVESCLRRDGNLTDGKMDMRGEEATELAEDTSAGAEVFERVRRTKSFMVVVGGGVAPLESLFPRQRNG